MVLVNTTDHGSNDDLVARDQHLERLSADLERLRTENRTLVRLNRLQERFVAMASHEFKTPLTSITAYTEALLGQLENPDFDRGVEFLGVIRDESARLLRMINRILDFSRLEYGSQLLRREAVDLEVLAGDVLGSFGALMDERSQVAELVVAPGLPCCIADADLVRQVLVNLVGNAVKYAPRGGHVRLTVTEEAATMAVEVADDGPGIPVEEMQRVFAEFYRASDTAAATEGAGLGLSIVRHIVYLHGGHVSVRRRRDRGTAFTIYLQKQVEVLHCPELGDVPGSPAIMRNLVRLQAEFTRSRTAVLLLAKSDGLAQPAAHLGLPADSELPSDLVVPADSTAAPAWCRALGLDCGPDAGLRERWLVVPVVVGIRTVGWILLGRRTNGRCFGARERDQVRVLGRLSGRALAAFADDPVHTLEALRVLLRIRWRGVPTATVEALDMAASLGRSLGLLPAAVARLEDAVALHDAGMDRIEDDILLGTDSLSPEDREEIDRHVALGLDLLAPLLTDADLVHVIRHHHERWDGNGYPDGLRGAEIPLEARTLAVLDAWFSLLQGRPGRPGLAPQQALSEIRAGGGTQFDPNAVAALSRLVETSFDVEETSSVSGPATADR